MSRKNTVQAKDIVIAMMLDGIAGVESLHTEKGFTKATCNTAAKLLDEKSKDTLAHELRVFAADTFGGGSGQRGRSAVKVGESRVYSVQQVGEAGAFIRLPVDLLGATKGTNVTVTFHGDHIVVRA